MKVLQLHSRLALQLQGMGTPAMPKGMHKLGPGLPATGTTILTGILARVLHQHPLQEERAEEGPETGPGIKGKSQQLPLPGLELSKV